MEESYQCMQTECNQRKREMDLKRRRKWRERVMCWSRLEVSRKDEDVRDEEEENEKGEVGKAEGESEVKREVEDNEEMGKEEESGGEEEEEENKKKMKMNMKVIIFTSSPTKETGEPDEKENSEVREENEENKLEWEIKNDKEEEKLLEGGEEEGENEEGMKGKEREEEDEEEEELREAEQIEGEEENTFERELEENEELAEEEIKQLMEEEQAKGVEIRQEDNWEGQQEQTGWQHTGTPLNWRSDIEHNQGRGAKHDEIFEDEEHFSDWTKSMDNSYWTGFEDKNEKSTDRCNLEERNSKGRILEKQAPSELQDPDAKSWHNEDIIRGIWTSERREERRDQKSESSADTPTNHEEKEESTADEEADDSMDEESNDQNATKIYRKDDYPVHFFNTLTEFRNLSILTDLKLTTEDGRSFQLHSPILAAVSSLIRRSLSDEENDGGNKKINENTGDGLLCWSMSLPSEVDHDGLEAIVEFAYSGLISSLNKDTVDQIKAAAQALGAPRVMDLCAKEEEKSMKTAGEKKQKSITASEQMMISFQSIKQLWMDRVGCDVILGALGASLQVHRVILAASSDYFRSMFSLGMKESYQSHVTLPFIMASDLEILIGSSYSGAIPLSWSCVFEIASISLQLQYQPALSLCLNFLQQEMNPHSCLDVASFAEAYDVAQLLEVANDFVMRQFQKVACTSKFKDLPAKQLFKYLKSCSLCVPSELVVFKAVVAWIQAKPKTRVKLAKELMKTIHFPLMTFMEFKEVQSLNLWSDHSLAELYKAVFDEFCSNETMLQSQCRIYLPKDSLVLIGGDQISEDMASRSISRELWFGNSLMNHTGIKKALEWRRLGEMPEPARFSHEVVVLQGQLYIFGGKSYYGIGDTLNSVYRYDPLQNSWERLADMQEKRCSFSVVVLDGDIYATGGHCDADYIDSVEHYCSTANSWSFAWPLDLSLSGHVAKVLQGQIFISGGLNSDNRCLASLFQYNPERASICLANMTKPRAQHCMESLGDHLYVAGGITTDDNMMIHDQLACEVYSPSADCWTAFASLPVPHVGAGSAILEGKFYVLGGYSQEDYNDTKMVHRYDPSIHRWENMGRMPGPNNDIRAVLLYLPPHVRL